jgi:hypothetical protein
MRSPLGVGCSGTRRDALNMAIEVRQVMTRRPDETP